MTFKVTVTIACAVARLLLSSRCLERVLFGRWITSSGFAVRYMSLASVTHPL